ncbi:hypothetical protein [Rubellicoccus peritrichatus]|uniref:DUF3108 domain-containing protein n=1 Tax=Rubellicoccus peritrichatus TaxID=3080537 RepID=A0AAQ3QUY8_9BACT|nr:hypothetical protein [Puniceicoccus sp. CR14]WOO40322.1 hypothetical protein RZN69_17015 [Puniceicoccus sp. CR14]
MKFNTRRQTIKCWAIPVLLLFTLIRLDAQEATRMGFDYSVISWEGSIKNQLYRQDGSTYVAMNLYPTSRTPWFRHQGSETVTFYTKQTLQDESHQYTPAVKATVPENIERALIIVTKNKSTNSFEALVVNDSIDICPVGSYRFLNWTDKKIAGRLGSDNFLLAPKDGKTIQPEKTDDKNLSIQLVELTDPDNQRLYSSRWSLQSSTRKLVLLVPRDQQGQSSVRIKIITDYGPPA